MDYVITMDIIETLANRYGIKEALDNLELRRKIENLQINFIKIFKNIVPNNLSLRVIPAKELSSGMIKLAKKQKRRIQIRL